MEPALTHRRLNAATVILWRAAGVVQLELGTRRIVVADVRPDELAALLNRPGRTHRPVDADAAELARVLHGQGFLTVPQRTGGLIDAGLPAYLGPELTALAERFGEAAPAVLAARRQAAVAVHGTSRITAPLAATLAAAGVGWVQLMHGAEVSAADSCPGGLAPADEGRRFTPAAVDAVHRAAPDVDTTAIPADRAPDLVVLTEPTPIEPAVRDSLHLDGVAHLSAIVDGSRAVVGPLVLPGVSSCLRCAELHRTDRDPAWPALAVQLAARPPHRIGSDVALTMAAVGVAAGQVLAHLDRQTPDTLGATWEWQLPDWRLRRRSWPIHHDCDCGAATANVKHGRMNT